MHPNVEAAMKLIGKLTCLALALSALCLNAADKWVITKDNGAYRVNGMRLMANGSLADANGTTSKNLTRTELDEIGAAIDKHEAGQESPYAAPAVAGPYKPAPESKLPAPVEAHQPEPMPVPSMETRKSGNEDPPAESSSSIGSKSILFVFSIVWLIGYWIYVAAYPNKCPRCGDRMEVTQDSSTALGSRSGYVDKDVVKTDVHRDNLGRRVGTTDRTESKTVFRVETLVETKYSCKKCRNKWLKKEWV